MALSRSDEGGRAKVEARADFWSLRAWLLRSVDDLENSKVGESMKNGGFFWLVLGDGDELGENGVFWEGWSNGAGSPDAVFREAFALDRALALGNRGRGLSGMWVDLSDGGDGEGGGEEPASGGEEEAGGFCGGGEDFCKGA